MEDAVGEATANTLPEGSQAERYAPLRFSLPQAFLVDASQIRRVLSSLQERKLSCPGWSDRHVTVSS